MNRAAAFIAVLAVGAGAIALSRPAEGGFAVPQPTSAASRSLARPFTQQDAESLAAEIIRDYGFNTDVCTLTAIAKVESAFDPFAINPADPAYGLMQVTLTTGQWLHTGAGYRRVPHPNETNLLSPYISMYYAAAYLDWLSRHPRRDHGQGLEWIVRSYNGGPDHYRASTDDYWRKFQRARQEVC